MSGLEVAVRCIHLASVLLLVGIFGFELLVSRPVFKTAGAQMSLHFPSFYKAQFRIAYLSLLLAIGTAILGLFIKIASATGLSLSESFDLGAIMNILTGTRFGIVWLVRMVLCCLLAVMMSAEFFGWFKSDSVWLRVAGFVLSATLLMAMAAAGHASAAEGVTLFIQLAMDGLHLLAAGVWLGGLIPLVMLLSWAKSTREPSTLLDCPANHGEILACRFCERRYLARHGSFQRVVFGRRNSTAARDGLWISAPRKARHPDSLNGIGS